jgi:hypothetical protein
VCLFDISLNQQKLGDVDQIVTEAGGEVNVGRVQEFGERDLSFLDRCTGAIKNKKRSFLGITLNSEAKYG